MKSQHKNLKIGLRGDTIVEVIVCIALLGTVMAVAYTSSTHSLQVGTDAGSRNRGLGFAQQQIEQIKYAEQSGDIAGIQTQANPGDHFCIDPIDYPISKTVVKVSSTNYCTICTKSDGTVDKYIDPTKPPGTCPSGDDSIYSIYMSYDGNNVFTVNAQWVAPNGSGFDNLTLYYKLPT
jgi:type II secretory pathway pseudopilin PulG